MFSTYKQGNKIANFLQRTSTSSIRLDCLQPSFPKVSSIQQRWVFFLEIAALYKLPSAVSSHLLTAKVFKDGAY